MSIWRRWVSSAELLPLLQTATHAVRTRALQGDATAGIAVLAVSGDGEHDDTIFKRPCYVVWLAQTLDAMSENSSPDHVRDFEVDDRSS